MSATFRYVSHQDTAQLDLRMKDVVPALDDAYRRVAEGTTTYPGRIRLVNPPLRQGAGAGRTWERDMRIIPAIVPGVGAACRLGTTAVGLGSGFLLAYWDFETMDLRCVISDQLVHGVRSAAPNGSMAEFLAREDAKVLGIIGTGRIARWAAEAVWSQRPIKTVQAYSRDPAHRSEFCSYIADRLGVEALDCASSDEAVAGADVVVMATDAPGSVINGAAISPGCTVITNRPEELDQETVRRSARIVASSALEAEAHIPPYQAIVELREAGELSSDPPDEICDIIAGKKPGRTSDDEIIVCLNPAHGVHDVALARFVYERALEMGIGVDLPI